MSHYKKIESETNMVAAATRLYNSGDKLDKHFLFARAANLFLLACENYEKGGRDEEATMSEVRAAICLEKSQNWRLHSAVWERVGDRLGNQINPNDGFKGPSKLWQSGMFHIICSPEWQDPECGYYKGDHDAIKRHQQAWSYMWAAQECDANQRLGIAARLFRKAALSFEASKWGEREITDSDDVWTQERIESKAGEKLKLAADCYFKATYCHLKERGDLRLEYQPDEVMWGSGDSLCGHPASNRADDVERLCRCLTDYGIARGTPFESLAAIDQKLKVLQDCLAQLARQRAARALYVQRKEFSLSVYCRHDKKQWLPLWLYHISTGSSSSIRRTLVTIGVVYCIIFPLLFYCCGLIEVVAADNAAPSLVDSLIFSLANALTLSVVGIQPKGVCGVLLGLFETFLAYVGLGYCIWIICRSFEE